MAFEEYELLLKKTMETSPDWIKEDIQDIMKKKNGTDGVSFIISQLYERYSFSLKHIVSAIQFSDEWTQVSRERLSFIDNNIEVIVGIYHNNKEKGKEETN